MAVDESRAPAGATFALSPQQERLWLLGPQHARYRARAVVTLSGPVDPERLERSLRAVTARHEILRTTFVRQSGLRVASQSIHDELPPSFEPREGTDSRAADHDGSGDTSPSSLETGPVVAARLSSKSETEHTFVLTLPAICADRTSLLIVLKEIGDHYSGQAPASEPLQYADYAEWRRELASADGGEADNARAFWQASQTPLESPPLLFARRLEAVGTRPLERLRVQLAPADIEAVERLCGELRVDAALLFEACWHLLLARLSGEADVGVATAHSGRAHAELADAVGPLTQLSNVISHIEPQTSLAEVVDQIRRSHAASARWQDYQPARSEAERRIPFGFEAVEERVEKLGDAVASSVEVFASVEPVELQLVFHRSGTQWFLQLESDPEVYDQADAEQIGRMFSTLVSNVVAEPDVPSSSLRLLEPDERARLLESAQGPRRTVPETSIPRLFEAQVERVPHRAAVVAGESSLSYGELDTAANRLAHHLRKLGAGRDAPVGLCLGRSTDLIVGLLGILKAGSAYVPLNDEHPPTRLAGQLAQAGVRLVVTAERFGDLFGSFEGTVVSLDGDRDAVDSCSDERPEPVTEPGDLAYVMYTSGSTGTPKGVGVEHRNLVNYATHMVDKLGGGDEQGLHFALVSAISTDLGNTCVFPALISGGTLHLISAEATMDGELLAKSLAAAPVDVLKITPTHLEALTAGVEPGQILPRRWLVLGGEALSSRLAESLAAEASCRILNHYGPTETTIGSCTFDVDPKGLPLASRSVPIGRPITNTAAYVLDARLEPVPPGVAGELFLGGAGVARGYVGQPEQTAERFSPDLFTSQRGARMYRTGDRVRVLADGNIEFLGRVDDQVKVRGYRVEPGEIESVLATHHTIRQAAVVPVSEDGAPVRLVAYLLPSAALGEAPRPSVEELRAHLLESLPDFMVPSDFAFLEAFPLTSSGKVDRIALREQTALAAQSEASYVAPRDETEESVAKIWSELLGVERVGAFDDFFSLGGNSLMATQVIMRVRRAFGDVPLQAMFLAPTVAGLAEAIEATRTAAEPA